MYCTYSTNFWRYNTWVDLVVHNKSIKVIFTNNFILTDLLCIAANLLIFLPPKCLVQQFPRVFYRQSFVLVHYIIYGKRMRGKLFRLGKSYPTNYGSIDWLYKSTSMLPRKFFQRIHSERKSFPPQIFAINGIDLFIIRRYDYKSTNLENTFNPQYRIR